MSIIETVVTFVMLWWLVFFLALPFGNEWDENTPKGLANSSPKNAKLKLKAIITTIITIIITLTLYIFMG